MADNDPTRVAPARARGIQRIWDPRVWGTTIGAAGATVFVMANRDDLPGVWPLLAIIGWAVAMLAYGWFVFVRRRSFPGASDVTARAGLIYVASVIGMLVLIRAGSAFLDASGEGALRPALIVVAVGLHFLPFAVAFHTPMFTLLGSVMAGLGILGLVLAGYGTNARRRSPRSPPVSSCSSSSPAMRHADGPQGRPLETAVAGEAIGLPSIAMSADRRARCRRAPARRRG